MFVDALSTHCVPKSSPYKRTRDMVGVGTAVSNSFVGLLHHSTPPLTFQSLLIGEGEERTHTPEKRWIIIQRSLLRLATRRYNPMLLRRKRTKWMPRFRTATYFNIHVCSREQMPSIFLSAGNHLCIVNHQSGDYGVCPEIMVSYQTPARETKSVNQCEVLKLLLSF